MKFYFALDGAPQGRQETLLPIETAMSIGCHHLAVFNLKSLLFGPAMALSAALVAWSPIGPSAFHQKFLNNHLINHSPRRFPRRCLARTIRRLAERRQER